MKKDNLLQIGKFAKISKVSIQTIRYYEKRKLIKPASHKNSRFRLYDLESLKTMNLITNLRGLGFQLEEIREIIDLNHKGENLVHKFSNKLDMVKESIRNSKKIEASLKKLISKPSLIITSMKISAVKPEKFE